MPSKPLAYFLLITVIWAFAGSLALAAGDDKHPHHIAMATGAAWHDDESSIYLGVDYAYTFDNGYSAVVFVEQVRGDFDLAAYGFAAAKFFDNGWKVATGPGVETKLKNNKTLFLWQIRLGYDWHFDDWTVGPIASFDFIEDGSNTSYFGVSVGYGF